MYLQLHAAITSILISNLGSSPMIECHSQQFSSKHSASSKEENNDNLNLRTAHLTVTKT